MHKKSIFIVVIFFITVISFVIQQKKTTQLPLIAIANYGPHDSLNAAIQGFKTEMEKEGFIDNKTIRYTISDVGFDPSLIAQMISSLQSKKPTLMVVMTTPVAQAAKGKIHDIPLIYSVITDPVAAGLIKKYNKSEINITGSSDKQDLKSFFQFAKILLPHAKKVGLLYATSESNDLALLRQMRRIASLFSITVIAIPIEESRDVSVRVRLFKNKVDFIYVGASGPIQPSLPAISAAAKEMRIPVFNVEAEAVQNGLAVASFAVDYKKVGANTGKLAAAVLRGEKIDTLSPIYPGPNDYHQVINKKLADSLGIDLPSEIRGML